METTVGATPSMAFSRNDAFMRPAQVAAIFDVSVTTLRNWELAGTIPRRIKISPRVVGWRASVIDAVIQERERMTTS